jgi:hypothetical protein
MESTVVLSYPMLKYPPDDLISDVILYRGTVHSLGHRIDIVIDQSSALLLLLKYPELEFHRVVHSVSGDHPIQDITVRIA